MNDIKKEFEERFVGKILNGERAGQYDWDDMEKENWKWFQQKLLDAEITERNIGAKLCAKKILNEMLNPTNGKFGSDDMNKIVDLYREAEKKGRIEENKYWRYEASQLVKFNDGVYYADFNNRISELEKE